MELLRQGHATGEMRLFPSRLHRLLALAVGIVAICVPFVLSLDVSPPLGFPWSEWFTRVNLALVAIPAAAAFNLLLGYTHQISVAHAAFLMLGTICAAVLGTMWGWPFLIVVIVAFIVGASAGIFVGLPALRFSGLYLLIATLGIHFVMLRIYRAFLVRYFGFSAPRFPSPEMPSWLLWLPGVTPDAAGQFLIRGDFRWYWLLLSFATISMLIMTNIVRTKTGRAFKAVKEHGLSASLLGIDVNRVKLQSFAVSSGFVTAAGAVGAYYISARGQDSFTFSVVLNYAIMIIVGGFSSLQGAVMGALFFFTIPVFMRWLFATAPGLSSMGFLTEYSSEVNLAIFGVIIIVVLVHRPEGLAGIWRSVRESLAKRFSGN